MTDQQRRRTAATDTKDSTWWRSRWALGGALVVVALIFVLENRDPVSIRLLIPLVTMPQWAALVIALVIGVLIGVLLRRKR
jgi:uncharacterized integral membrane protein